MIRPTGKETMDAGKIIYYTGRFQVGEYTHATEGHRGAAGSQESEGKNLWARAFLMFSVRRNR